VAVRKTEKKMEIMKHNIVILVALLLASLSMQAQSNETKSTPPDRDLAKGFGKPPASAKPQTWWHLVSGNVSKEGITADLEAMKKIGLSGIQLFTVDQSDVKGPIKFMSSEWRALVRHAMEEAKRLELEISIAGCDGWSESGGPWVPPAESMQKVVWSQKQITGGQKITLDLPQPEKVRDFYEDIGFFAFPVPANSILPAPVKISSSEPDFDASRLVHTDGKPVAMPLREEPQWIEFEYAAPVSPQSVYQAANVTPFFHPILFQELQAADESGTFRKVCQLGYGRYANFAPATSTKFRFWRGAVEKKYMDKYKEIPLVELSLGGIRLDRLKAKVGMDSSLAANEFQKLPLAAGEAVDPASIVNLTGQREWQAPPGNWTLLRIGHTSTGATTHPSTTPGLECNKLSPVAVRHHLENMFGPVIADSPASVGTTFKNILLDSWEVGCENWTAELPAEFQKRRGYDLIPWLPALTGSIIDSAEQTQRFLWDYRRTLADLLAENHYGETQKFAREHGMGLTSEATGIDMPTVADQLLCKKFTDIPMGEFWVNYPRDKNIDDPKEAACAAHLYGQNIASAESFTSVAETAAWKNDPYSLKALGDQAFCLGVNQFVFHRYTHQPWLDRKPGMSMGPWGINFERTNTWWDQGSAWMDYITRCQYLLQQGVFRADLCYFYGEGVPATVRHNSLSPSVPNGYDYDVCNADVLLNLMEVKDGRITTPSGMSYRVLVLPPIDRMTLPVLQKIAKLVNDGAVVYGPKPLHSPSLTGYPGSDSRLTKLANELWGSCDGKTVTEHSYGKGKIVWGEPLQKVLGVPPDFTAAKGDLLFIHRKDADAEIYFVSSQEKKPITTECSFRVTGKVPEIWHPDTGKMETVALYACKDGVTTLPIPFDPVGSVFVVFRKGAPATPPISAIAVNGKDPFAAGSSVNEEAQVIGIPTLSDGKVSFTAFEGGPYSIITGSGKTITGILPQIPAPLELAGPWDLTFPPKLGAPERATFENLISWSDSAVEGIKYFSGTATYTKSFELPKNLFGAGQRLFLDLGEVKNLAEVSINGKPLGILWKEPFRVEITDAAKPGNNQLTVKLTNLWPNRLIGDEKLPESQRITWASVSLYKADSPLLPSGLLGPVKVISAQTIPLAK
jgi:hypothetical protein